MGIAGDGVGNQTWFAHTAGPDGKWHNLIEHLKNTSELAESFAVRLGMNGMGSAIGLLHDEGKFTAEFQAYLADTTMKRKSWDHSTAGAVHVLKKKLGIVGAFIIAGHHSGLSDRASLKERMENKAQESFVLEALGNASRVLAVHDIPVPMLPETLPARWTDAANRSDVLEVFIRMLFSCLVDADFLDTETHFDPKHSVARDSWHKDLGLMAADLEVWAERRKTGTIDTALNRARQEVYQFCVDAAEGEPGVYSLTVPTGFGKTVSGMAFALHHAVAQGKERVIVAVPYTSIIDQNAQVYREIFGEDYVLEHHSTFEYSADGEQENRWKLATENWNVPLVVTTTVQLFESLFANRPAAARKLHNIANSVIILDEVQMLPLELLQSCFSMIRELKERYGVTFLFSTATPIATELTVSAAEVHDLGAKEIIPKESGYFSNYRRVEYDITDLLTPWSWERVASEVELERQVMVVVNTRNDAVKLFSLLSKETGRVYHLSASMCAVHRSEVLSEVMSRLKNGEPVALIATQVVEAGVDIDFPVVMRAIGPLDRIAQAAGRCNREGKRAVGRVVVFVPEESRLPSGSYQTATQQALNILLDGQSDLHEPETYEKFFRSLYNLVDTDGKRVESLRVDRNSSLQFAEVAARFKMISDDSVSVVIPYENHHHDDRLTVDVNNLVERVQKMGVMTRDVARQLQRYTVNVYRHQTNKTSVAKSMSLFAEGWYLWTGKYDDHTGLALDMDYESSQLLV